MIYICFKDEESLGNFLSSLEPYSGECGEASEEGLEVRVFGERAVVVERWGGACASLLPCEAYLGTGFYDLGVAAEAAAALMPRFEELACRLVGLGAVFIALGENVLEPLDDVVPRQPLPHGLYALYIGSEPLGSRLYRLLTYALSYGQSLLILQLPLVKRDLGNALRDLCAEVVEECGGVLCLRR